MTTKANILLIAPELSAMSDNAFSLAIADAVAIVTLPSCPAKVEMAQRYLAAHLLTIARPEASGGLSPSGAALTSEKAGRESRGYGSAVQNSGSFGYGSTKYGIMFETIVNSCSGTLTAFVV